LPLALLALWLLSRHPRRGLAAAALVVLAIVGAPDPDRVDNRAATWHDGIGYSRTELAVVPVRTGRLEVAAPQDASVVALDPGAGLDLALDDRGACSVSARWGEPIRLLVEAVARAD